MNIKNGRDALASIYGSTFRQRGNSLMKLNSFSQSLYVVIDYLGEKEYKVDKCT